MSHSSLGSVLVASGPSGVGKSSICRPVLASDSRLHFSISCTTRAPRPGETDGVDYQFLERDTFRQRIEAGDFLEHAEVHGNLYGTLRQEVERFIHRGDDVLLDIDVQGAQQLRDACRRQSWRDLVHFVFIGPPTYAELERRLRGRGTEEEAVIRRRLDQAWHEMQQWHHYDYLIINHDLDTAIAELRSILQAVRLHTARRGDTSPWPDAPSSNREP